MAKPVNTLEQTARPCDTFPHHPTDTYARVERRVTLRAFHINLPLKAEQTPTRWRCIDQLLDFLRPQCLKCFRVLLGQACELIKVQFVQIGISHDGESRAACAQACRKQGCSKAREAPLTTHKQAVGLNPESVLSKTMTTT